MVLWGHGVDLGRAVVQEPVSMQGLAGWATAVAEGDIRPLPANGAVVSEYESTIRHNGVPEEVSRRIDEGRTGGVPPLIFHPGLAVHRAHHKYVAVGNGDETLYDVDADPQETRDLAASRPELLAEFRSYRDAWEARRTTRPDYETGEIAEGEIAEHLRTLGYIE